MLGLYLLPASAGWRAGVQAAGPTMLVVSPVLLTVAFILEPQAAPHEDLWWSHGGLYLLFGGSMAHAASATGTLKERRP